ncbi:hypothetical protein GQ473_00290 [archaeon]|nr:hypothetical protein [archaeon]
MKNWIDNLGFVLVFVVYAIGAAYTGVISYGIVRLVFGGMGILSLIFAILLMKDMLLKTEGSVS